MKAVRKRLTYANVVSSLALFLVVAGGSAFAAAQLGKNSVGAKQLKKNAVTAAKLKKNAVTAAKIKPGAVTGAKINESTLGTVPSATTAGSATTAASANVAASLNGYTHAKVRLTATPVANYSDGVDNAPETTVVSSGPISLTAKCFTYGSTVYGFFLIRSSTEGTVFDSYNDYTYGSTLLGPGTPAADRELFYESASGDYAYYSAEDGFVGATAADGTTVRGTMQVGVKQGNLAGSQGPYGPGNVCLMAAQLFNL